MKPLLTDELFSRILNESVTVVDVKMAMGGSINKGYLVQLEQGRRLFVKTHRGDTIPGMYKAEARALHLLKKTQTLSVPECVYADEDWLVLDAFQEGTPAPDWQEQMGRGLARLQQKSQRDQFGFDCDNFLGTTFQSNTWHKDWLSFWREQRLEYQLRLFSEQTQSTDPLLKAGSRLLNNLDDILACEKEPAVLLHGDLWSGNAAANEKGEPVIFDPASYYGHRETEFGMMRLFGGFGSVCEAAYQEVWPFQPEYNRRIEVYRLYHQLNHLNIFGSSYYDGCLSTTRSLL